MARIRTIKPAFWTDEQVLECSPLARLLFIGLWTFSDDKGVHPASVKTLKAEVMPADDITAAQIRSLMDELITQGLVQEFSVQGRLWWHVTGWHHQLINRPTPSRYPSPPRIAPLPEAAAESIVCTSGIRQGAGEVGSDDPSPGSTIDPDNGFDRDASSEDGCILPLSTQVGLENNENTLSAHGALSDDSLSDHGALTERSLQEGNSKGIGIGIGKEGKEIKKTRAPERAIDSPKKTNGSSRFEDFWAVWPEGYRQAKQAAVKAWDKSRLDDIADTIIADVTWRKKQHVPWLDGYIPNPSTYLNGRRWEDEIQTQQPKKTGGYRGGFADDIQF